MYIEPIPVGTGAFTYRHEPGRRDVPVWTHRPAAWTEANPILVVLHGYRRNGADYRDAWAPVAERHRVLVAAPEFTHAAFATPRAYEVGNMRDQAREPLPRAEWNYWVVEGVFDRVRAATGAAAETYDLFGHSAGAQLVHRLVTFLPEARVARAVAANAGAYTLPDAGERFPYGLQNMPLADGDLARVLGRTLLVMCGENDTDENERMLLKSPEAMRQGPHRRARGEAYVEAGAAAARRLGVPFGWGLVVVPGIGHSNQGMAGPAARLLYGTEGETGA